EAVTMAPLRTDLAAKVASGPVRVRHGGHICCPAWYGDACRIGSHAFAELVVHTHTKHVGRKADRFRSRGHDVEQDRLAEIDIEIFGLCAPVLPKRGFNACPYSPPSSKRAARGVEQRI